MSQKTNERILAANPFHRSSWIGEDAQMFARVRRIFVLCGYQPPETDMLGGTGAYVSNIEDEYHGLLSASQVLAMIEYARAHMPDELAAMDALDVDDVVFEVGAYGLEEPYTAPQVATMLDLSEDRIRRLAVALGVGRKYGRDWLFSAADVETLRARNTQRGRPPQQQ